MKSGTIFDNFLITDDEKYAESFGADTWGVTKVRFDCRRVGAAGMGFGGPPCPEVWGIFLPCPQEAEKQMKEKQDEEQRLKEEEEDKKREAEEADKEDDDDKDEDDDDDDKEEEEEEEDTAGQAKDEL